MYQRTIRYCCRQPWIHETRVVRRISRNRTNQCFPAATAGYRDAQTGWLLVQSTPSPGPGGGKLADRAGMRAAVDERREGGGGGGGGCRAQCLCIYLPLRGIVEVSSLVIAK